MWSCLPWMTTISYGYIILIVRFLFAIPFNTFLVTIPQEKIIKKKFVIVWTHK